MAELYLASFKAALPTVRLAHSDDQVRAWMGEVVVARREAWLAEESAIVGLIAIDGTEIDQLYVAVGHWQQGIGRRLLDLAKERSPRLLELWTFQVNHRAVTFYRANGFAIVESTNGAGNEEREPDHRLRWRPSPFRD